MGEEVSECVECGLEQGHRFSCSAPLRPEELEADFESHKITGFVPHAAKRGMDGVLSVPLISHIHENLWSGGCINSIKLGDDFKNVISLYKWEEYKLGPDTKRYTVEMYDSNNVPPVEQLEEIVDKVFECLGEGKTLVHCQAGLNRSGLISAMTLIRRYGMTGDEAIDLLREKRCHLVLCNKYFEDFVRNYG